MGAFLKTCGIGVLVIVLSPFWALGFLIYVLIGTIMLLLSPIKMLYCLGTHRKFTIKTGYDRQAEAILNANSNKKNQGAQHYNGPVQQVYPQQPQPPMNTQYPPYQNNPQYDPRYNNMYGNNNQPQPPYNPNPYNYGPMNNPNNQYPNNQYPNNNNMNNGYNNNSYDPNNNNYGGER